MGEVQCKLSDEVMELLDSVPEAEAKNILRQVIVRTVEAYDKFSQANYNPPFNQPLDRFERSTIQSFCEWLLNPRQEKNGVGKPSEASMETAVAAK